MTPLVHRISRQLFTRVDGDDTIEPIVTLANTSDTEAAFRERTLRQLTLAVGLTGAYLIEEGLRDHRYATVSTRAFASAFHALTEGLDDAQREALALGPARVAALAALDELRVQLSNDDLATARRLGRSVVGRLEGAFPVAPAGEGVLGRPIVRDAAGLAVLAERALAWTLHDAALGVGRARQLLHAMADVAGGPRDAWETRPEPSTRRAFFSEDATAEQIRADLAVDGPSIALGVALLHPATRSSVAERLGCTLQELATRLWDESDEDAERAGPRLVAEQVGDDLLIERVPEIPEDERPVLYFLPSSPRGEETRVPHPLSAIYGRVRTQIRRLDEFRQHGDFALLVDIEARGLQRAIDDLVTAVAHPFEPSRLDAWGPTSTSNPVVRLGYLGRRAEEPATTAPTALWLTDQRIALATGGVTHIVDLATSSVARVLATDGVKLQACDDEGRAVIVSAESPFEEGGVRDRVGCFDAATGDWRDHWPEDVPAVVFARNDPEDGGLCELRRGLSLDGQGDRPAALAFARGNRAVLTSGDGESLHRSKIVSTSTGFTEVSSRAIEDSIGGAPMLRADGTLVDAPSDDELGAVEDQMAERWSARSYEPWPAAITRTAGGWRFLAPSRHVADVGRTLFVLGFAFDAASFSPDGERLLVVGDDVLIIEVGTRAVVWRMALPAAERS